ncbi:MAG: M16 family metallopeptidase [Cytophagales bacterium]|nr:MAG: peptidase M16 [Rhodothermaeota bacterium MED-G16]
MKRIISLIILLVIQFNSISQNVEFVEYDLDNGLHVILHQDKSVPLAVTSVMYHVGSKDDSPERTGFAHFFEHLLFEGTENIDRGQFMKIVESNGGSLNAYTSNDETYYYEFFPSNKLELGLWLESERMLHPVIDEIGVKTQNEVVKEEKRLSYDNRPYGQLLPQITQSLFKKHPYRWLPIGSMDHLDSATLDEFIAYNKKFYVPNNAVLVVAGNFEIDETKNKIKDYFGPIPRGNDVPRIDIEEDPLTAEVRKSFYDPNIQLPMGLVCYRIPSFKERDSYVLDMISSILSSGKSSRLYKKMVDTKKVSVEVQAINLSFEDYGVYVILSLPVGDNTLETLYDNIDEEIVKLKNGLITDREYEKLQNEFENSFVNTNSSISGIANSLASYYLLHDNVNLINERLDIYRSITKEEIMEVANKYLNNNSRAVIDYLPESAKQ